MSYARFGEGDVYVYGDVNDRHGELRCCACRLLLPKSSPDGIWEGIINFVAKGPAEMLAHLQEHAAVGDRVPTRTMERLRREAKTFERPRYPVHYSARGFIDADGTRRKLAGFSYPACGQHFSAHYRKLLSIKKSESGHAHPRDQVTRNLKAVTCKYCKERIKNFGGYARGNEEKGR